MMSEVLPLLTTIIQSENANSIKTGRKIVIAIFIVSVFDRSAKKNILLSCLVCGNILKEKKFPIF
jgi:hypothetical protein